MKATKKFKDSGIYYYKNKVNGKLYIGQAQSLKNRRNGFKYERYAGPVFNNAKKKYGLDNFEYGILTHCSIDELNYYEMFYIKRLNTKVPNGYNMTDGGEGFRGGTWTEEHRQQHRERVTGSGNPNYGHRWNDNQRKRLSDYMKKRLENGPICVYTQDIKNKIVESRTKKKYGKTFKEIDEIILNYLNNGGEKNYAIIKKIFGFAEKTIKLSFERLGIINDRSQKMKNSYEHNKLIVQCDRRDHSIILNIFPSLTVATKLTGIKTINHCTHGPQESAGGYFWRFGEDGEIPYDEYNEDWLKPLEDRNKLTNEQYEKLKQRNKNNGARKTVYCFNKNKELIDVCDSVTSASKKYKLTHYDISSRCLHKVNGSFIGDVAFSYKSDGSDIITPKIKKYYQYSKDGILLNVYDNIKDASINTGCKESSISSCLSGKYKSSQGFIWKIKIYSMW